MERIAEPDRTMTDFARLFPELVLVSGSANRKALLETGGCRVHVRVSDADEIKDETDPEGTVLKNAERKISTYLASPEFRPDLPAVSADTLVMFSSRLLGKPADADEAMKFYSMLSGRMHEVLTGTCIYLPEKKRTFSFVDRARVWFRPLERSEMEKYLASKEYVGAAGGYRLQKTGYTLVDRIEGDWTNVVGLPLERLMTYRKSS